MNVCDIDTMRDLLVRLDAAKKRCYREHGWGPNPPVSDALTIERQLQTYLVAETTVAALTKCVEAAEKEAAERYQREEKFHKRRHSRELARNVVRNAEYLAREGKLDFTYQNGYDGKPNTALFLKDCKAVLEWLPDPWDENDV